MKAMIAACLATLAASAAVADGPKYAIPVPDGIAAPATVDTRLGTLSFTNGVPSKETAAVLFDNLDFQRAVQAYLLALPAVNQAFNFKAIASVGPVNTTVPIWEDRVDARTIELTANDNTPYTWFWIDLTDGPLVLEVPPKVLGLVNDMWYRWVQDVGLTGPDKGQGGKYLLLPPGYTGAVPDGYTVIKPETFKNLVIWRSFLENGDAKPGVDAVKAATRIYRLDQAANPPALNFVNMSGKPFNMVNPAGYAYWDLLNSVVQSEPTESLDPVTLGFYAAIGIEKGKPFAPDERMKRILTEAAAVGDATARSIAFHARERVSYYYDNSAWQLPFVGGYKFQTQPGVANLDGAAFYYFMATGVTPAMEAKMVGEGSQYAWAGRDAQGNALDGGKDYVLHLPKDIPVKTFWSVILYSNQTRSMIMTDQKKPSVSSQSPAMTPNADGSVDVWFGPQPPAGKEGNWVQTMPGEGWNVILRLYGPLEPWFDGSWRPGEIEPR